MENNLQKKNFKRKDKIKDRHLIPTSSSQINVAALLMAFGSSLYHPQIQPCILMTYIGLSALKGAFYYVIVKPHVIARDG